MKLALADRAQPTFRAACFVGLACVVILALSLWREWIAHEAVLHNAQADMSNLARALTQHADDTFQLADTVLIGLVERLENDGMAATALPRLQGVLNLRKAALSEIHDLVVCDEAGNGVISTVRDAPAALNIGDRSYFQQHRQSPDRGILIGPPVRGKTNGDWIITVSRRFNHPDGGFAGVVMMSIDVAYFAAHYRQFDLGPRGSIALLNTDGIILNRSPDSASYVGRDLSDSALYKRPHGGAGSYNFTSPLDGVERLSFYRWSARHPILILATRAKADVFASWYRQLAIRLAIVLSLVLMLAAMGFYIVRQLALRQRMAAELAGRDAEFRALAEGSSDVVTRIALDGTVLYASPSARRLIGWSAEQLTGRSVFAGMHADDVPKVKAQLAALIGGEVEEARISYRTRHSDKREIWLDAAVHLTRHLVTAEVDSIVAIARDVTEQKRLEDQLAALATSDSLTGIANRRRFDERLREEWARARRDGTPLSLLLIDVDHFKEYNDRYGHPAGDRCLSWIAAVLAELARRPSDLAARYGGEEFAMILANTDAAGCEHVSRQIREALRGLELAHAGNPPSERVTVSLGGATLRPVATRGRSEPGQLIESADRALYAAKHGGRDRLVMSAEVIRLSESSIA